MQKFKINGLFYFLALTFYSLGWESMLGVFGGVGCCQYTIWSDIITWKKGKRKVKVQGHVLTVGLSV